MRIAMRAAEGLEIGRGVPLPLGAHPRSGGVNFALFSRHASAVHLLLFERPDDAEPSARIPLDAIHHRTGDIWHVWVNGPAHGRIYGFAVDGPHEPARGHRFNPRKLLLDPYAHALAATSTWDYAHALGYDPRAPDRDLSLSAEENARFSAKCLVPDEAFDWAGDRPLRQPWSETVIYETHVRGLTVHPSSSVAHPGTFLGIIEKIPYLRELGINCVELMPIQEFNERELARPNPVTGEPLRNYWGYSTAAFFAPKESYGTRRSPGCQVSEFKTMVRELHRAGIEVLLDVVLNHTAERNELGPTLSFRGLDNRIYYLLDADPRFYRDFTGCGNTLRCNHPVVRNYVLDCLRHWVMEMHVDGFRFDLASVLGRGDDGALLAAPPLLEQIAEDPILRDAKLVAEAWDAAGAYQVGTFAGGRWSEWNGRYRDDVRRFWRSDPGMAGAFATRLCGSADLYERPGRCPVCSVNFVTSHDGFTLADLVSYGRKHNDANGEANRDGLGESWSDNNGFEGTTSDPAIVAVRARQARNLIATLLLSRGVPMLLGGDEFGRTQGGNDNAWCHDSETSWYDWGLVEAHRDLQRFTAGMIAFRRRHEVLRRQEFYSDRDLAWLAPGGGMPRWTDPETRALGCLVRMTDARPPLCLLFNAGTRQEVFAVPPAPGGRHWRVAVDTSRPAPHDLPSPGEEPPLPKENTCQLRDRSLMVLIGG